MKHLLFALTCIWSLLMGHWSLAADAPLRVYIRSGPKSHGPGAHDHPSFLRDWVPMLNERGAKCEGGDDFPTKEQLANTDVLVIHRDGGGDMKPEEQAAITDYAKRGGGIVVIHAGSVANTPEGTEFYKHLIGGSWLKGATKWLEAPMSLYFTDHENPITGGVSNFDMDDEIYYDMDILPEVKVLAAAYTPKAINTGGKGNKEAQQRAAEAVAKGKAVNIYDIQPQMWTYERTVEGGAAPYRAFVCIPGHYYVNFSHNALRTVLLRGIAWAGKRGNADMLSKPAELGDALRYLPGGCPKPQDMPQYLEVHPEFNISLVASEPLINKAMNIDWDPNGRMWVCETPEYPNGRRLPKEETAAKDAWKDSGSVEPGKYDRDPLDRISILTDTDGDGIMDKKKVFADKLELCTSFCFYKNGVIACAAPDIWFLEDTNGDDVADKRTKLYTGLGTGDTHAVINNLRWGLDGWIYATHGYSAGNVTSGDGSKNFGVDGAGVVRFKPDGRAFEQYASRGGNTWGLDITWDGQVFFTQPTSGNHFLHVVLPEYVLAKGKLPGVMGTNGMLPKEPTYPAMQWEQQAYVQIDQVGSYTAAAGCAIYEGGAWPAKWNYGYFTTEPTLNIVSHFMVEPASEGSVTFKAHREPGREHTEFIRSKNLWFRPIEVRVGPDGALYVVDFCNQAVIHNDTRGPAHGPANAAVRPDRDHYYGRIWKVQHKDAKKLEVARLDKTDFKSLEQIVRSKSANVPTQQLAWRLLDEAGKDPQAINIRHTMGSSALKLYELRKDDPQVAIGYFDYDDPWIQSAMIAAMSSDPVTGIQAAFGDLPNMNRSKYPAQLVPLVEAMVPLAMQKNAPENAAKLLTICAGANAELEMLTAAVLRGLAQQTEISLSTTPALKASLQKLLTNPSTAGLALPLAAKWDTKGELASATKTLTADLVAKLGDTKQSDAQRAGIVRSLIAIRQANAEILPAIRSALTGGGDGLKREILTVLGEQEGEDIGNLVVASYASLKPAVQLAAFDQLLKRPEWAQALLSAIEKGKVKPADLGPSNVARLRTHPNKQVASRANKMLEKLSPTTVAKNQLIAQLAPEVEKPGDAAKGKVAFALCSTCHKLGDLGQSAGPPLDGMGAHGPAELLVHIIDPNREVDPSFWAQNIVTRKGEAIVGVITSENASTITLATQLGVKEVLKTDIATRENTRRSLMPEGLEALGAENLRDLLAFICGDALKHFRIVDLKPVYTADNREGVFASSGPRGGVVRLAKYGNVNVNGIPFFIQDASKSATGSNIIVLKGGPEKSQSWTYPQRVEVPVNAEAKKLHFLSGIAGWGYPAVREHVPALKATVTYAGGETEEFTLKNGEEFADYIRPVEVPVSQMVEGGISDDQQVRLLSLTLTKKGLIKKLTLESFANGVAPVIIAITADVEGKMGAKLASANPQAGQPVFDADGSPLEYAVPAPGKPGYVLVPGTTDQFIDVRGFKEGQKLRDPVSRRILLVPAMLGAAPVASATPATGPKEGGKGDAPLAPVTAPAWEAGKTKVLIIGGGSSHNFPKFFGESDSATLKAAGFTTHYTEDRDQAAAELNNADVAIVSVNRKFFDTPAYRKALFDFVAAGKGLIMLHPGTWYAFADWPELNAQIVGGGARGHDALGPFTVNVVAKDHPIMKGVPATFDVTDELYYVNAEPDKIPAGTASIELLAQTSPSKKFSKPHPSVWVAKHDKARIIGIALGHDERVHDLDAYKTILSNAVKWVSARK